MDRDERSISQMGLKEMREIARQKMPREAWEHIMGAAESRATFRRNQKIFSRFLFRQKIFHEITSPDTTVELFGRRLPAPLGIAPIGSFSLIRDTAEHEVAEGGGKAGAMIFASHAAKSNPPDWAKATTAPLVFMGYMSKGKEEVLEFARQAEKLGYAAVGLTMDVVEPVKVGDHVPLSTRDGKPRKGQPASPKDIERLKSEVSLPVVVKGIMGAEDARIAVGAGADALVVSNHGGRILDFNRAALEALPEVVEAVGKKVPVLLDSGIRSGGDVVKALALGARAVLIGRPICWGVAAGGAAGVERVIQLLTDEIKRVLMMTGLSSIKEATRAILIPAEQRRETPWDG
ncbi:MAG: alpha-hydroxy-acid oxidizing protein [Deltaproteobacteria bacterium]|nr:alpha-hydroxy-acid oxidizing protein [Deltaproteobacteria bacterium]